MHFRKWLRAAGSSDVERFELVRSFETRNVDWQPSPAPRNKTSQSRAREALTSLIQWATSSYLACQVIHAVDGLWCTRRSRADRSAVPIYVVVLQRSGSEWTVVSRFVGLGVA
jgi:hypothetical protein